MKGQIWALSAVGCLLAGTTGWLLARAPTQPLVTVTSGPLAQSLVFSGRGAARVRVELGAAVTALLTKKAHTVKKVGVETCQEVQVALAIPE